MIQVEPISAVRAVTRVGRTRSDGTFRVADGAMPSLVGVTGTAEPEAMSLVSLQEAAARPPCERDRVARGRCDGLLAALRRLQRASLGGVDAPDALDTLRALAAEPPDAADPGLRAILATAVTRARVELARDDRC